MEPARGEGYQGELECPVCLDAIDPPVFQCANGHLICGSCLDVVERCGSGAGSTCPVCRIAFSGPRIRNLFAEQRASERTRTGGDASEASAPTRLPPGWRALMVPGQPGCVYYADMETQASQWDPPPYIEYDWKRLVDSRGQAFWACGQLGMSFYESDGRWHRYLDFRKRVYWSNQEHGIRFFEPELL